MTSDTRKIIRAATKHRAMIATTHDALKPDATPHDLAAHRIAVENFVSEVTDLPDPLARYVMHYATQGEAERKAMWDALHDRLAHEARLGGHRCAGETWVGKTLDTLTTLNHRLN